MEALSVHEIVSGSHGILEEGYEAYKPIAAISIDSREIKSGDLFIPIVGERLDGHDFIKDSLDKGAVGALLNKEKDILPGYSDRLFIRVNDTRVALGNIASAYKRKFKINTLGVTGSNGKTTSKEMIASVLATEFKVHKSSGNLNTEIGLPLSILGLTRSHQISILEMGMNQKGDIARLCRIARPNMGIITNIGEAHIGPLGSRRNIAEAKWELAHSLPKKGVLFLNADDPYLWEYRKKAECRVITFGVINPKADIRASRPEQLDTSIRFELKDKDLEVRISAVGINNVYNALAAVAVGEVLGLDYETIRIGLQSFRALAKRMEISMVGQVTIANDSYNANPTSVKASLHWLASSSGRRKIALLGDMLELGDQSSPYHQEVGRETAMKGIDILAAVGDHAHEVERGATAQGMEKERIFTFRQKSQLVGWLANILKDGDVLLVKGSRGMELESVVSELKENMQIGK